MARFRLGLAGVLLFLLATGLFGPATSLRVEASTAVPTALELGVTEPDAWASRGPAGVAALSDPWDEADDDLTVSAKAQPAHRVPAGSWRGPSPDATAALRRPCPPSTGPPASRAS